MPSDKDPKDAWEALAEALRSQVVPDFEAKLASCRDNPPNPASQPATSLVVKAYVERLELKLAAIRGGAEGLKDECLNHPKLTQELNDRKRLTIPPGEKAPPMLKWRHAS
jgi:hypothetical protein